MKKKWLTQNSKKEDLETAFIWDDSADMSDVSGTTIWERKGSSSYA